MKRFTREEINAFKILAKLSQDKLQKTVYRKLREIYGSKNTVSTARYLYAKGEIPIVLVAHMDTVFPTLPQEIYFDKEQSMMWSPDGLGADDRAGVFAILKILSDGFRPHIILTKDEEKGGLGAIDLSKKKCPFEELKFIIELDRQGEKDCVFYDCNNPDFEDYIEDFGFETDWGTFSDISELCPAWGVAGVNLSIGYYDEHTYVERLNFDHMMQTIRKVECILSEGQYPFFKFIPGGFEYSIMKKYMPYYCICRSCGKHLPEEEMIDVYDENGHMFFMCGDCVTEENVEWCDECYEGYKPGILNEKKLCPKCAAKQKRITYNGTNNTRTNHKYSKTI